MKKRKLKAYIKELEARNLEAFGPKVEDHSIAMEDYFNLEEARKDLEFIRRGAAKKNTIIELEERLEFVKKFGVDPYELKQGA